MDVTRVKASEGGAKCVRLAHSALWPHRKTNMQMTEHPTKSVRRAGVPLVALETADPAMAIAAISGSSVLTITRSNNLDSCAFLIE